MSVTNPTQSRTLWMGEIDHWMDEGYVKCLFNNYDVQRVKILREKIKKSINGYGFIEFNSIEAANKALQSLNGKTIPNTDKAFKLNWACYSIGKTLACNGNITQTTNEYTIYVGDLDSYVTEDMLKDFFSQYYYSILGAKLVVDPSTKISKGYGFVKFSDQAELEKAMIEMNGKFLLSRPIRLNQAVFKKSLELMNGISINTNTNTHTGNIYFNNNNANINYSFKNDNNYSKFSNYDHNLNYNAIYVPNKTTNFNSNKYSNSVFNPKENNFINYLDKDNIMNSSNDNEMIENDKYDSDNMPNKKNLNRNFLTENIPNFENNDNEDFQYQQMLLKSITMNKNLNNFYINPNKNNNNPFNNNFDINDNKDSTVSNNNNFCYVDFFKKNNLLEYIAKKYQH